MPHSAVVSVASRVPGNTASWAGNSSRSDWLAHFDWLPLREGRFSTGLHPLPGLQRHFRPQGVERPGLDLLGEMAEKPTLLGGWVAMAAFLHRPAAAMRLHFEIAALDIEYRVARFEGDLASGERQDKIRHPEVSTCATHIHPLLVSSEERTVEAAGDSFRVKEFGREFCRHRQLATRVLELREDSAGHSLRKPPVHGPEGKSDAIPTEITQASVRLQVALRSNIGDEEILRGAERKCRSDPPDGANGLAVIEHFPDSL